MNTFAQQIRHYRARLGINREACAALLGVHWRTVANWEQGRVAPKLIYRETVLSLLAKQPEVTK